VNTRQIDGMAVYGKSTPRHGADRVVELSQPGVSLALWGKEIRFGLAARVVVVSLRRP
jgi:hypothetical protein